MLKIWVLTITVIFNHVKFLAVVVNAAKDLSIDVLTVRFMHNKVWKFLEVLVDEFHAVKVIVSE